MRPTLNPVFKQHISRAVTVTIAATLLSGCSIFKSETPQQSSYYKIGKPYKVGGKLYVPKAVDQYNETGLSSWYGHGFHGKPTANGEIFDQYKLTAAHKTLPMPSILKVTNLENGKTVNVRVNDRGPFVGDRVLDVSYRTAQVLGFDSQGVAKVKMEYLPKESRVAAIQAGARPEDLPPSYAGYNRQQPSPFSANATQEFSPQPSNAVEVRQLGGRSNAVGATSIPAYGAAYGAARTSSASTSVPLSGTIPTYSAPTNSNLPDAAYNTAPVYTGATTETTAYQPTQQPTASQQAPQQAATYSAAPAGRIFVQAGAFKDQGNAQKLVNQLNSNGYPTFLQPTTVNGEQYYRVRVGPINSVGEAENTRSQLAYGGSNARVVID